MRLLADANIGFSMVAFLQEQGHDVVHAATLGPRFPDAAILNIATSEHRVVLTSDKDFGELVFRNRIPAAGVILLRLTVTSEVERVERFRKFWPAIEKSAEGHFVVVTNRSVRRSPLPAA